MLMLFCIALIDPINVNSDYYIGTFRFEYLWRK